MQELKEFNATEPDYETEAKKLKRERKKEDEEIAALTKEVAKLTRKLEEDGLDLDTIGPDGLNVNIS